MARRSLVVIPVVAALALAAPAVADTSKSVTSTGSAFVKVVPKNRMSNASIQAAVEAAHKKGIKQAMDQAHEYALLYAKAAKLTLGSVTNVSDASNGGGFYYFGGPFGAFAPNQFCGTFREPVIKIVNGKKKVVRTKKVKRCFVPPFENVTLTVTYSAT